MELYMGPDNKPRCRWCGDAPQFLAYHDQEWGFPVADDRRLFEKLCLESFQAGLSWRTILVKRENFRAAFDNFEIDRMARFTEHDVERLLSDAGIIRHRGKIEAVINNARCAQQLIAEAGSLAAYFWSYEPDPETLPAPQTQTTSAVSAEVARALKKRGWRFVGPTTIYSFMQAMGLINDHADECIVRSRVSEARRRFVPPR